MIHVENGELWFKRDSTKSELKQDLFGIIKVLKENDYLTDDEIMLAVASGLAGKYFEDLP